MGKTANEPKGPQAAGFARVPDLTPSKRRWLIAVVFVLGVTLLVLYYVYVMPGQIARARWAEIGRPMAEFEKTLKSTLENQSWRDLLQESETLGASGRLPDDVYRTLYAKECSDVVGPFKFPTPWLDSHSEELERLYRRILSREPPIWTMDYKVSTYPNEQRLADFMSIRQLASIITADAKRRLSLGDQTGAEEAMRAISKITENFQNSTDSYALWVGISIRRTARAVQIHLPEAPENWAEFARRAEVLRENCRLAIQLDALREMKWSRPVSLSPGGYSGLRWLLMKATPDKTNPRTHGAAISKAVADTVQITTNLKYLNSDDLGSKEVKDPLPFTFIISNTNGYSHFFNLWRSLQEELLAEERMNVLRHTRDRLHKGQTIHADEFPSATIPGAQWVVTLDAVSRSATLRLSIIPEWADDPRMSLDVWFLPLDGSKSWQFAPVR